ncbi:MAG: endonuclease MutS2 [Clostridia bacterium]|nr:endonuclease MutS2 [Clostridia bacterium]
MEERNLKVLEYDKILKMLSEKAVCAKTKENALNLRPTTDRIEAERLLAQADEAFRFTVKHQEAPIAPLTDIVPTLKRAEVGACLSCREIKNVGHVLRVTRLLKAYMRNHDEEYYPLLDIVSECMAELPGLEREIDRCILSDDELADDASSELYSIRRRMEKLSDKIRDVLSEMIKSERYRNALQESLVTMRNGRYVLPVKSEHRGSVSGIVHDASGSGATVFVEPMQVVEINNEIHKLVGMEKEEIERILSEFTSQIADYRVQIGDNYKYILEADMIFARARLALDMDATVPELNDDGVIEIHKGRHPLIDKRKVVPVDVYLGRDFDTLVITGPNTGGKTVTLKTLGLFTLMAQTGLMIPAKEGSCLSVFTRVFADIGDEQSIEQSLSTFSSHMVNIVKILNEADDKSLVLFDELGAGTDPAEGAALAMAILEYVRASGAKTAATTHYSEVKLYALSTDRVENAACEFDLATLSPTYRLLIGIPGKSNAFAIASKLGVSDYIIGKAKENLTAENIHFEDLVTELEKNKQEAEAAKEEAERIRQENYSAKKKLTDDKSRIDKQKDSLLQDARREAKRIVEAAKKQTEEMLEEVKKALNEDDKSKAKKTAEEIRKRLREEENALSDKLSENVLMPKNNKIPKNLLLGQEVEVLTLGQRANVMTLPDAKGNLIVQTGILKVTVNISALRVVEDKIKVPEKKVKSIDKTRVSKTQTASTELDLRGLMSDEAFMELEKFIDDAVLAKIETVRVIHGKGTGVLRAMVHQYCRQEKRIKSFRLGAYGEGEAGVTVITIK